ncbi:glycosyltransferase family 2 protein [Dokdonia sinensis]|uniref:Glycosyltransferase family 2 protein n=1 Tax=Dokdonia sinensis TaxID=2479847 RepID=A0A3M0FXE9_9FLAO|nr:glycosyltransferase family 2 protein [Dokdonia sinensis]RMB57420.1 glycosyltransferase family 2 protein [Dokdonia sinensis]
MDISFLIVTRNRPADLRTTLDVLKVMMDHERHEVRVFIDGCEKTEPLIPEYDWVHWSKLDASISASPARNALYKNAQGTIFIGLDDDAHPLSLNFIEEVEVRFRESKNLGILAFQEVRGLFATDTEARAQAKSATNYLTNDFVGCGFAIKKTVYEETNGFPLWMDIYGEESAVAIEVLDAGYDILYCYDIQVNHRVDVEKRKATGRNYFRFEHQLQNTLKFYIVYYPKPLLKILKALLHNFRKYALTDLKYFKSFSQVVFSTLFKLPSTLKYRITVSQKTIDAKNKLAPVKY